MIHVYTQPACPPCKAIKLALDKAGIDYVAVDIAENPSARNLVKNLGYNSTPVVVVSDDWHWSGFKPSELDKL
ncbi:glutaredoxin domain-containing protein [Mycolicibacterium septicum]|uniref:glutaredoxin domain-containing protein n=1 Tax=Mycolicibacterium septicum TaxID=98668 RepID=UPI001AF67805|nr:glutaredoxin domain-containing protein [Mycolicibacterium septicum]QRY51717.1 NrdH-redoxin [Mycolicibacterium septicum]